MMLMKAGFLKRLDKILHSKVHLKLAWWCVDSICSSDMKYEIMSIEMAHSGEMRGRSAHFNRVRNYR